jgi:hypothetical protein
LTSTKRRKTRKIDKKDRSDDKMTGRKARERMKAGERMKSSQI